MLRAEFGEEVDISVAPMVVVFPTGGIPNTGGLCAKLHEGGGVAVCSHHGSREAIGKRGAFEFRFNIVIAEW
jgi:hypothetical protein